MSALRPEHGHRQVGTWNILVGGGHMHGQHTATESAIYLHRYNNCIILTAIIISDIHRYILYLVEKWELEAGQVGEAEGT
jgi:hypothetical protein